MRNLCTQLEELAEASDLLCSAIEAHDAEQVKAFLDDLAPKLAHTLSIIKSGKSGVAPQSDVLTRLGILMERFRDGQRALESWQRTANELATKPITNTECAARFLDNILPSSWSYKRDLLVLIGANSFVSRELVRRGQARLLVYLPERAHLAAPQAELPPEAVLVSSCQQVKNALFGFPGDLPERTVVQKLPGFSFAPNVLNDVNEMIADAVTDVRSDRDTIHAFGELWITQGIRNLPWIASWPSIDSLRSSFQGKPLVVIAPGPSLEKNVHVLKELKGKALLVTFSHTLGTLKQAGVVPDLVITVDPENLLYHFDGYPVRELAALILGATIQPRVFRLPARRVFTFASNHMLHDLAYYGLGDEAMLSTGGSVANSALSLALKWKCDPVIFVGLDLAFGENGNYYAPGSKDEGMRVVSAEDGASFVTQGFSEDYSRMASVGGAPRRERALEVTGYYGGKVKTSLTFKMFLRWFEDVARSVADRVRLVNCTEGGVHIKGMDHIPLKQATTLYGQNSLDVERILDEALARTDVYERRRIMSRRMDSMLSAVETCITQTQRWMLVAENTRISANSRILGRLDDAASEVMRSVKRIPGFSLTRHEQIRTANLEAVNAGNVQTRLEASLRLFGAIRDAASIIRPVLVESREVLGQLLKAA